MEIRLLDTPADEPSGIRLSDILENREDELRKYFCQIQSQKGYITKKGLLLHESLIQSGDPTAIFLNSVSSTYRVSLKLIQLMLNSNEDPVFNIKCPLCGNPLTHERQFTKNLFYKMRLNL